MDRQIRDSACLVRGARRRLAGLPVSVEMLVKASIVRKRARCPRLVLPVWAAWLRIGVHPAVAQPNHRARCHLSASRAASTVLPMRPMSSTAAKRQSASGSQPRAAASSSARLTSPSASRAVPQSSASWGTFASATRCAETLWLRSCGASARGGAARRSTGTSAGQPKKGRVRVAPGRFLARCRPYVGFTRS